MYKIVKLILFWYRGIYVIVNKNFFAIYLLMKIEILHTAKCHQNYARVQLATSWALRIMQAHNPHMSIDGTSQLRNLKCQIYLVQFKTVQICGDRPCAWLHQNFHVCIYVPEFQLNIFVAHTRATMHEQANQLEGNLVETTDEDRNTRAYRTQLSQLVSYFF